MDILLEIAKRAFSSFFGNVMFDIYRSAKNKNQDIDNHRIEKVTINNKNQPLTLEK